MKYIIVIILLLNFISPTAFAREDIVAGLKDKLKYLNRRQAIIAKNIANIDTPKYKALDLQKHDFRRQGKKRKYKLSMATTSNKHISPNRPDNRYRVIRENDYYDMKPNGNNVVLEEQLVKMNENTLEYSATVGLIKKMNNLVSIAIGGK